MSILPEFNDTLFFPKESAELIRIGWYQDDQWREADYYRVIAYTVKQDEASLGGILTRLDPKKRCELKPGIPTCYRLLY